MSSTASGLKFSCSTCDFCGYSLKSLWHWLLRTLVRAPCVLLVSTKRRGSGVKYCACMLHFKRYKCATPLCTVSMSVLESLFHICVVCVCVHWFLQRAYRNIFPLLRGAAALLSQSRSHAAHCICVLCVTSCVRLWIVSETMVCFALKGHLNHLPLGCKHRRIQRCCSETICIFPPVLSLECSPSPEST